MDPTQHTQHTHHTHQDRDKQLPQAPMPGGFEATSQPGYNPALNPATDLTHQQGGIKQGGLPQGEFQEGGLQHQGGLHQQGEYQQGGLHQGDLGQGGLRQDGLHQGGIHQGGLHQGAIRQDGLHQGGLHQDNLNQNDTNQPDLHQRGLHAHNPRNADIGLSHDQHVGTHHHHEGTHNHPEGSHNHDDGTRAHHAHQGAAVLSSSNNYGNDDDLSNPSSTTATHGSVESRKGLENNPSTTKGIKDTLAGNLQKIAGALTGNDQRRVKGEAKAQEGKIQVNAAKSQSTGRDAETTHGHGRGDMHGTHLTDVKELEPVGGGVYGAGTVPNTGHGRGGLENKELGNDSAFANANTGKAKGLGHGRGGLEGIASREE